MSLYESGVTYYYKDKPYQILHDAKLKLDGQWYDAIVYKCLYPNPDGMIWVRFKTEFFELFKTQ